MLIDNVRVYPMIFDCLPPGSLAAGTLWVLAGCVNGAGADKAVLMANDPLCWS